MLALVDTVAWVRVEDGRILCARPRGKDIFDIPGGGPGHRASALIRRRR